MERLYSTDYDETGEEEEEEECDWEWEEVSEDGEGAGVVVAWGEQGAACHSPDHGLVTCDAHPPPGGVLDTLGAGDTFNAATIGCLASGLSLAQSVEIGCKVRING